MTDDHVSHLDWREQHEHRMGRWDVEQGASHFYLALGATLLGSHLGDPLVLVFGPLLACLALRQAGQYRVETTDEGPIFHKRE